MRQVVVSYLANGIILSVLIAAAIIFVQKKDNLPVEKGAAVTVLLLTAVSGFAAFLFHAISDYLKDLRSDSKRIYSGQVTDKSTNTNWGWHGNPGADSCSQPKLIECFLVIDKRRVCVEEDEYNSFGIGDRVKLYFTTRSNILLGVAKESHSGNKAQT
ncbi:hypothetical protein [Pontibacter actiniarum]|uniref:Uncharacterized protein n=1 Tax=Pontibacter actiniarum TaxID=323450 RepID=A0A1X9YMB5_9BACT|nr:hypothetical protein [Pontibacter actiniarum]ARS34015.1 hypothetical protein CA264_00375 [Pontibacter actiniarum]